MIARLNATVEESSEHIVLYDVSWTAYEQLLEAMGDRRFRHTYARGVLEIMSPSKRHDRAKSFLGRLIESLALEWDIEIDAIGSTTLRKSPKDLGLEPDECYYVAHVTESLRHANYDAERDPPPDLAVEVDVTNSSLSRMPIYAELGVPELWCLAAGRLTMYRLVRGKRYEPVTDSKVFSGLPSKVLEKFIRQLGSKPANSIVREFIIWLRENKPD